MVTKDDLRAYLRLTPDNTENLDIYLAAATDKARAAGIPDFKSNSLYDLFILSLASLFYDNRSMETTADAAQMINSFVLELRYSEDGTNE